MLWLHVLDFRFSIFIFWFYLCYCAFSLSCKPYYVKNIWSVAVKISIGITAYLPSGFTLTYTHKNWSLYISCLLIHLCIPISCHLLLTHIKKNRNNNWSWGDSLVVLYSVGMTSSGGKLFRVDVIVLDEVHYLSDISRGTVWEEIVCTLIFASFDLIFFCVLFFLL